MLLSFWALILSLIAFGQPNTQEFTFNLNSKCWLRSHAYAETITGLDTLDYGFLGLSAYTLDTVHAVHLEYRVKHNNRWQEWQAMLPPHEGAPKNRQSFAADPIMQSIEGLEIRASDTLEQPLVVRLFWAPAEKKNPEQTLSKQEASGCNCPLPPTCNRSCWCPNNQCPPPAQYTPTQPTHLIVHHSAGFTNYNDYNWVVSYYWDLHVNTNGWDDIGYNWLVDPNGVIYEGRGSGNRGAHFSCMNEETLGICLIGNYVSNQPAQNGLSALANLLAYESCQNQIAPADSSLHQSSQLVLQHVSGHLDGNTSTQGCPKGTLCPGQQLYQKMDSLALAIAQKPCLLHNSEFKAPRFSVYPNPAQSQVSIQAPPGAAYRWQIFNAAGQVLQSGRFRGSENRLDLNLPKGVYLLKIQSPRQNFSTKISLQ